MTFDEAKRLLASVAVLDNRNVDSTTIQVWQAVLDPFTLPECMYALREFARNNTQDYLRPAHLVDIIRRKRADYAAMNPGREAMHGPDAWLAMESELEHARQVIKEMRAEKRRLAVEAMEEQDE